MAEVGSSETLLLIYVQNYTASDAEDCDLATCTALLGGARDREVASLYAK
jgi:hypothetical protein